jgi:hypothetical protein
MKNSLICIGLAVASCQGVHTPTVSEINFDSVYKTKSGFEVRYVLDADGSVQRWNVFRPLESGEKYRTLDVKMRGEFVVVGDFLIIPFDLNKENSWQYAGINCEKKDYANMKSIGTIKIKCVYDQFDGYSIYEYSQERGVLYLEEGCSRCGADEIEILSSELGLGARISNGQ